MHLVSEAITHVVLFIALYFEVFLLITYFEIREEEKRERLRTLPETPFFPSVSVIVPVWNEENTVLKTIFSLLKLNYPKDKLSIYIVDDGSSDNTWKVIQRFRRNKQIKLLQKENGGKHTALNYALEFIDSELVGCLDADSFVHPEALKRLTAKFVDKDMMAVTPSIIVHEPKGILQLMQKAEYLFGIFLRKVLSHLGAIYITPGPFSIFRREVFRKIGNYRHAYNTEDMEMAMRMQKNGMKIGNVSNAFVYTVAPRTFRKLYIQRLRWVYGFIKNAIDYRDMFFKPKYGHLGVGILPAASFSLLSTLYLFGSSVFNFITSSYQKFVEVMTVGLSFGGFKFDLFYFDTNIIVFVSVIAIVGTLYIIMTSRSLAEEKHKFGVDSVVFLALYTLIAPLWMSRAVFNAIFSKGTKWR